MPTTLARAWVALDRPWRPGAWFRGAGLLRCR